MSIPAKQIRVVFAQSVPHQLPALTEIFACEDRFEIIEAKGTLDEIWKQVVSHTPDVMVFYTYAFGDEEKRCIQRILRGIRSKVLLLTKEPIPPALEMKDENLEVYEWSGPLTEPEEIYAKVKRMAEKKAILPRKKEILPLIGKDVVISEKIRQKYIVAVGASTGGTEALAKLFHDLPATMPGIVVVQHMPPVFTKMYAERLDSELPFEVREADDNILIQPGTIHIAPGNRHLMVRCRGGAFYTVLGKTEKVSGHCPSVDVLFESVAREAGKQACGVILTGMGADGASGLLSMRQSGAYTFGQDEASSVVYGMPKKAYEYGAVAKQAPLSEISKLLIMHFLQISRA